VQIHAIQQLTDAHFFSLLDNYQVQVSEHCKADQDSCASYHWAHSRQW